MLKDPFKKASTYKKQFEKTCPECGHTVSEFTVTCPKCGTKLKKGITLAKIISVFVIIMLSFVAGTGVYLVYRAYSPGIRTSISSSLSTTASTKDLSQTYNATDFLPKNIEGFRTSVRKDSGGGRSENGCGKTKAEGSYIKNGGVLGVVEVIECDSQVDAKNLLPEIAQELMLSDSLKTKRLKDLIKAKWAPAPSEPTICFHIWQQNRFAITVMTINTEGEDPCELGESIANTIIKQSPE